MKNNLIITIGRENGSGGRYVGEKLAKELGINCYNNELITTLAKESGEKLSKIEKYDEKKSESILYFGGMSVPTKLFREQSKVIKKIADKESCIIIGRCANYILNDYPNKISIFIYAPLGSRIERYSRRNNTDVVKAEKEINKVDRERANYYKFYTNKSWNDMNNYDLCIDTSKVGIDGAVKIIKEFIKLSDSKENRNIIL